MIRRLVLIRRPAAVALTVLLAVACGGGGGSNPTTPIPTPIPTATPNPAPTPVATTCPLGLGSGKYNCYGDSPGLLPRLDAAIDKLVRDQPQLFGTENPPADRAYLVNDVDAFYDGVIANLTAEGMCAERSYVDKDHISIKEDNTYNEAYDILTTQNRIRRGPNTYLVTCAPANFPLTAELAVARVSVSFFRYTGCPDGTVLPPPHNTLPLFCRSTITATPRDAQGNKLPPELHSDQVRWFIQYGDGVTITSSPNVDTSFNLNLYALAVGEFSVCATVGTETGCMNGQVIP